MRPRALRELGAADKALPASRKLEEAKRAYEEARAHRAALRAHQRAQQQAMQRFDLFRADLEAMGIQVVMEPFQSHQSHIPKEEQ